VYLSFSGASKPAPSPCGEHSPVLPERDLGYILGS
jgi:hypothetical protein